MSCRSTPSTVPRATCRCSGVRWPAIRPCTERWISASIAGMSAAVAARRTGLGPRRTLRVPWRAAQDGSRSATRFTHLVVELLTALRFFHRGIVEVELLREHLAEHVVD